MEYADFYIFIFAVLDVVFCRECYNYKEDPKVRNCNHGCCGNKYEEYCCNVTLQIIGCAIGGLVVVCIIFAVAYYCYRKKSKVRQHGGLFGRLGMRSNLTGHQDNSAHSRSRHIPPAHTISSHRPPQGHVNPAYMQQYTNPPNPAPGVLYPSAPMQAPSMPTAPMPPPYSMEPPPYIPMKEPPPPPAYNTVVSHMRPGYKYDEYYGDMPPPSS